MASVVQSTAVFTGAGTASQNSMWTGGNPTAGNRIVARVEGQASSTLGESTIAPAGWTLRLRVLNSANVEVAIFDRVATGGGASADINSGTWSNNNGADNRDIVIQFTEL